MFDVIIDLTRAVAWPLALVAITYLIGRRVPAAPVKPTAPVVYGPWADHPSTCRCVVCR